MFDTARAEPPRFDRLARPEEPSLRATWGPLAALVRAKVLKVGEDSQRATWGPLAPLARALSRHLRRIARDQEARAAEVAAARGGQGLAVAEVDYEAETPPTKLTRYVVDLRERRFSKTRLSPRHIEFPSVAPAVAGARHRYVYSTPGASATSVTPQRGVLKTDTEDASQSQIWLPPSAHDYCGEAIFTPRAAASTEDDGYLLTLCFDGLLGTSSLLVLDARDVAAGPIARVPVSVEADLDALPADAEIAGPGHGLHATFVPSLTPSLAAIQQAEDARAQSGARFLADRERDADGPVPTPSHL